ncbi:putative phage tail protein [Metaclostridioides mangenotii]|uniref:putative phage tail protein n=1 Tax=Metaclostridioides mangenotii TaxID=1540 RepID=UPI0028F146A6|nr:putative phage tail protein [Clostridioides mangenotii]
MLIDKEPLHEQNYVGKAIQGAYDKELELLRNVKQDTFNQFFVDTATWGLDHWEKMLCIKTNTKLNDKTRRSNIKAKMRGRGTTTIQVLKSICEAYVKSNTTVTEHAKEFYFTLDFIVNNTDYNTLLELDKFINQIKPCHLYHKFNMTLQSKDNTYIGLVCNSGEDTTIYPWFPTDIELKADIKIGSVSGTSIDNTTIYPREVI